MSSLFLGSPQLFVTAWQYILQMMERGTGPGKRGYSFSLSYNHDTADGNH